MKETSILKFDKNENEQNEKSSLEEESNIIIPDDDYIEILGIQNENKNNNKKKEYNDNFKNIEEEFIIEENNKQSNDIQNKELTLSKKFDKTREENCPKNNDINQNKGENENKNKQLEEYEEEEGEENLIIDYDDETNSHQPENKSFNSIKKNLSLEKRIKSDIKAGLDINEINLNKKFMNIENNKEEEKIIYNKINSYKINTINKELNNNKFKEFNNKSQKIDKKLNIDSIESEIIDKGQKTFNKIEEENRINYLLSSKNNFNEKDAKNLLDLKKVINDAIIKTKNNIQKINKYEINTNKSNNINKDNNNNKRESLKIEQIEHISLDYSYFNKIKNNINTPINVENINLIGNKGNNKINKDNKYIIQKIIFEPYNDNKYEITSSNKKIEINNIEKYSIIYNNEFSFAPPESSSHNKEKEIFTKQKNIIINNNYSDIKNKNSNKELEEINKELNEISNSQGDIINNNYFINDKKNKGIKQNTINNNIININTFQNGDRLINEEMIRNFLSNHKNERILQMYNISLNSGKDKNIEKNEKEKFNYKYKYLGYTLEGSNRNKEVNNLSYSNKNKIEDNNISNAHKDLNEDINKIKINQNKDNDNNISGLNNICNMLNDLFHEDKAKKCSNNSDENINKSLHKNVKIERNTSFLYNNKNKSKEMNRTNSNTLDFSNFNINNENIINYYDEEIPNFNEKSILNTNKYLNQNEKSINDKIIKKQRYHTNKSNISKNKGMLEYIGVGSKIISQQIHKKKFHLSKMDFNQRLEHFSNKKNLDIKKIKSDISNIEEDIYTFYPKTNKKIQKIKYENKSKSITKNNRNNYSKKKAKINYKRINELYMDYKERNIRLKNLAKENDIKDGISFNPYFCSNNYWKQKSKKKIKALPYLKLDNM